MSEITVFPPAGSRTRLREISHLFLSEPATLVAAAPAIIPVWLPAAAGHFALLGALTYGLRMHGTSAAIAHADPALAGQDPRTHWPRGAHRFASLEALREGIADVRPDARVCLAPVSEGAHDVFCNSPIGILIVSEDGTQLTPTFQALKQIRNAGCRRVVALATVQGAHADRLNGDAAFARLAQHARIYIGWQPGYVGAIRLGARLDESPNAADVFGVTANLATELDSLGPHSANA
jgi:hypothetical protein